MRSRLSLLAGIIAVLALALVPSASLARSHPPRHVTPKRLTINVTKNPIDSGDAVTIFGQLQNVADKANRTVVLWHRLPNQGRFTRVQKVQTDAAGFYQIPRAENVVRTNRSWFVTVGRLRSRTIDERVRALLTLNGPASTVTNQPVRFTGHITPSRHRGDRVFLQVQVGGADSDDYRTIDSGRVGAGSNYVIVHRFLEPGTRTVRVLFRGDRFNTRSVSSPTSIDVSQRQNQNLTLGASQDPINYGQSVTLSGVVKGAAAGITVTLRGHIYKQAYATIATTTTASDGSYSFTVTPRHNTVYQTLSEGRRSAQVFEGVRDVVNLNASSTTSRVGESVTFSGFVQPDKVGHRIFLQRKGEDGDFHTVQVARVGAGSAYSIRHTFGSPGTKVFRVLIPGGAYNHRGISNTATVEVAPKSQP